MLTEDHNLQRVEISQRLLQRCQQDNGDEGTTHIGVGPRGDFQANNNLFDNLCRGGMAFETEDDLISELRKWFDNLDVYFFRVGINSLLSRWQKCIDLHGDYVEK
ncbi:histone-lysine N-methyltransferase SETMAR [Plakobranchus ocellatus]|uniref:Histone-lysine N-methyltransferase SETMAR n=1 Tax=Plakobranchus ocellatus TaxID=259542 RepID=A0AAV4AIG0_9GAST|nr:histone-lysine N-methyltransferase SETMAR [Plakobranchus ocellatus]